MTARSPNPAPPAPHTPAPPSPLLLGSPPLSDVPIGRRHGGAAAGHQDRHGETRGTVLDDRQALRLYGLSCPPQQAQQPGETADLTLPDLILADLTLAERRAQAGLPGLIVRPAQVQGAAWQSGRLERRDLRAAGRADHAGAGPARQPGVALHLSLRVSQVTVGRCLPRAGVRLDLWHADAQGRYADHAEPGGPASGRHAGGYNTRGQDFLRGFQLTGEEGEAHFTTLYPGWVSGQAPQLHLRLQTLAARRVTGEFSTPLFFDDALSDRVYSRAAYRSPLERDTRNEADPQYRPALLLDVGGTLQAGLHAHIEIGLNI